MIHIYTVYGNMWISLIYCPVGSEDVNKMTQYIKPAVTKVHWNVAFGVTVGFSDL
jgi:hypothetical protein